MQYKKYDCNTYTIHTIKTDKFKNCTMEVIFRKGIKKEEITKFNFLADMLSMSNKTYKTRREVVLELEKLYSASYRSMASRVGNCHMINFITTFLNPKYCEDEYLDEVIDFSFDMLLNPNIKDDEFDKRTFTIERNRMEAEINSLSENAVRYALRRAMINMDERSPISYNSSGYLSDLEKITPSNLYTTYKQLLREYKCDIYIIGDLDMDYVVNKISKTFTLDTVKDYSLKLYNKFETRNKPKVVKEDSDYEQSSLIMVYNTDNLTKRERDIVIHLYNMIFGAGNLNCKLTKSLREENSLCYSCSSMYNKYDNALIVYAGIASSSYDLSVKLVKKAIKEMVSGKISDEEIENNKLQLISSVKMNLDMEGAIINNYFFHNLDKIPLLEDRIELIKSVTKKEIVEVAKKIKLNIIYLLKEKGE